MRSCPVYMSLTKEWQRETKCDFITVVTNIIVNVEYINSIPVSTLYFQFMTLYPVMTVFNVLFQFRVLLLFAMRVLSVH